MEMIEDDSSVRIVKDIKKSQAIHHHLGFFIFLSDYLIIRLSDGIYKSQPTALAPRTAAELPSRVDTRNLALPL